VGISNDKIKKEIFIPTAKLLTSTKTNSNVPAKADTIKLAM
jgi:hypothetical protein